MTNRPVRPALELRAEAKHALARRNDPSLGSGTPAGCVRLTGEVEQLQVELGYALAPDEDDEPLTLRDVDPDAVYATEDDDYDDERAEAYQTGQDGDR